MSHGPVPLMYLYDDVKKIYYCVDIYAYTLLIVHIQIYKAIRNPTDPIRVSREA